jgi:nucleoid-associated protein YgaU
VEDLAIRQSLWNTLQIMLKDTAQAWELQETGNADPVATPMPEPEMKQDENPSSSLNKDNRQSQLPSIKNKRLEEQAMLVGFPPVSPAARFYTVKEGDTLGKIAEKIYGNATEWKKIYIANRHLFKSKKGVEINQKIALP